MEKEPCQHTILSKKGKVKKTQNAEGGVSTKERQKDFSGQSAKKKKRKKGGKRRSERHVTFRTLEQEKDETPGKELSGAGGDNGVGSSRKKKTPQKMLTWGSYGTGRGSKYVGNHPWEDLN